MERPTKALSWSGHQCQAWAINTPSTVPFSTPLSEKSSNVPDTARTCLPSSLSRDTLDNDFSHVDLIPSDGSIDTKVLIGILGWSGVGGESKTLVNIPVPEPGSSKVRSGLLGRAEAMVWRAEAG